MFELLFKNQKSNQSPRNGVIIIEPPDGFQTAFAFIKNSTNFCAAKRSSNFGAHGRDMTGRIIVCSQKYISDDGSFYNPSPSLLTKNIAAWNSNVFIPLSFTFRKAFQVIHAGFQVEVVCKTQIWVE